MCVRVWSQCLSIVEQLSWAVSSCCQPLNYRYVFISERSVRLSLCKLKWLKSPTGFLKTKIVVKEKRLAVLECGYHNGTGWNHSQHAWYYSYVETFQAMLAIYGCQAWYHRLFPSNRLTRWLYRTCRPSNRCRWTGIKYILSKFHLRISSNQIKWHCNQCR